MFMPGVRSSTVKRRRRAVVATFASIGVALGGVAGCGGDDSDEAASGSASSGGEQKTLKMIVPPHAGAAPIFIAQEKGYFEEEGLVVTTEPPTSPASAFPALATGEIDVMNASISSGAIAIANGQPFKLAAVSGLDTPGYTAVVSADPDITTGADLVDKKVAVVVEGANCDLGAKARLESEGVDSSKIQWVELPQPAHVPALERGDVDAVCAVEPVITELKQDMGARIVVDASPLEPQESAGFFMRSEFVEENPGTVEAFRSAIEKATEEAQADEALLRETMVEILELPEGLVADMTLPTWGESTTPDPADMERVLADLEEQDILPKPLTVEELLPSSVME